MSLKTNINGQDYILSPLKGSPVNPGVGIINTLSEQQQGLLNEITNREQAIADKQQQINDLSTKLQSTNDNLSTTEQNLSDLDNFVTTLSDMMNHVARKHTRELQDFTTETIDFPALFMKLDGLAGAKHSLGATLDVNGAITFVIDKAVSDIDIKSFTYDPSTRNIRITKNDGSSVFLSLPQATTVYDGFMSAGDKDKLNNIQHGSQMNLLENIEVNGTRQDVSDKTVNIAIPTTTNQLTNNSGFLTTSTGASGVKGNAEATYRTGQVNITPANIGLDNVTNVAQAPATHVGAGGTAQHPLATTSTPGFTSNDFTTTLLNKLNGLSDGGSSGTLTGISSTSPILGSGTSGNVALSHAAQTIDTAANNAVSPAFGGNVTVVGTIAGNATGHLTSAKPTQINFPQHTHTGDVTSTNSNAMVITDNVVTDSKIGNRILADNAANGTLIAVAAKTITQWLQGFRDNIRWLFERRAASARNIYTVTSGTVGHLITTDIPNTTLGQVNIDFKASRYNANVFYHSTITAYLNNGTILASSLQKIDLGLQTGLPVAYLNSSNMWCFFIPHHTRYMRVEATATIFISANATTASAYNAISLENRITSIAAQTTRPTGNETSYLSGATNKSGLYRAMTILVATSNGSDIASGFDRTNSVKTIAQTLSLFTYATHLTIQINKSITPVYRTGTTAITAYDSAFSYAVGDLCTSGGYVWRRLTAGTGTTPASGLTVWEHVNLITTSNGTWGSGTTYALGNTVLHSGITYISMIANNVGNTPNTTFATSPFWKVIGEHTPVLTEATPSISNFTGVSITSGDANIEVIFLNGLTITNNNNANIAQNISVGGTLTLDASSRLNFSGTTYANIISGGFIGGLLRFGNSVLARSYIVLGYTRAHFHNTVTVFKTDNLSRAALRAFENSDVSIIGTFTAIGFEGANTGTGLRSDGNAIIKTLGNLTINGFREQIYCTNGGTIECRSTTVTLGNTTATGTIRAIQVDAGSKFIKSNRTTITRNNSITDNINSAGKYIDETVGFYATLTSTGWTTSGNVCSQTVNVTGITADMVLVYDIDTRSLATTTASSSTYQTMQKEAAKISRLVSNNGSITVYTWDNNAPTVQILLALKN